MVAALIRWDSPGPALFVQRRRGFNHREFKIYKFRTMTTRDDGDKVVQATANDPRVTRVGRILRKYNIDELPQLFNVLLGDMSLVGPRPHAVAHDRYYEQVINCYGRRVLAQRGGLPVFDRTISDADLDPPAPTPKRLFDLGAATARILARSPYRVALLASSGWSHAFLTAKNHYLSRHAGRPADVRRPARLRLGHLARLLRHPGRG